MIPRPCLDCGEVTSNGSRCEECQRERDASTRPDDYARERMYGAAWRRLSRSARRAQPWCLDCGSRRDLTTDHTPEAMARLDAGLPLRPQDVEVVCRACNSRRGRARGRARK